MNKNRFAGFDDGSSSSDESEQSKQSQKAQNISEDDIQSEQSSRSWEVLEGEQETTKKSDMLVVEDHVPTEKEKETETSFGDAGFNLTPELL